MQLVQLKVARGFQFGIPDCIYSEKNLFETTAQNEVKSVIVGMNMQKELIRGNVSVDYAGDVEKYVGGEFGLVITEWNELKRIGIDAKGPKVVEVIGEWDRKIRAMVENSSAESLFIILSGEGDVELAAQ